MEERNLDLEQQQLAVSSYGYSAIGIDDIQSTDCTLATVLVDVSGSVLDYADKLRDALVSAVDACKRDPMSDRVLLRVVEFNSDLSEHHGFKPLDSCDLASYRSMLSAPFGMTALLEAIANGCEASVSYAKQLADADFGVNGVMIVITDGLENASSVTPAQVKAVLGSCVTGEILESMTTILVGIGAEDKTLDAALLSMQSDLGLTQYVPVADASAENLARLGKFVSKSISSASRSLGTGSPGQSLTF